jgi:hypothetical protein
MPESIQRKGISGRHVVIPFSESVYEHLFELTARPGKNYTDNRSCGHTDQLAGKAWLLAFPGPSHALQRATNTLYILLSISTLFKGTCLSQCVQ